MTPIPMTFSRQANADFTRHSIIARFKTDPPTERLSVLAGECIHALRSALDHLAYAIAVCQSGVDPPPYERWLQFPIADTKQRFGEQEWRIKTLSSSVRAKIETLQPYNRPHPSVPPLLSLLREFDDADKHRLLNVVVSAQFEGELRNLSYAIPRKQSIHYYFCQDHIEDGTETFAVTIPTPDPKLTYDMAVKLGVAIQHGKGPDEADLSEVWALLSHIRDEVKTIVEQVISEA